ncbi:bifunctional (p)ppGpp synthetase/guanosine-3',5'-bis(diphosphate) 3'-pyrophosphohydrolase [Lysobacter sp. TY2-98]|uniref:RelA/SpoT family protein n=1 Tax=Lysobacter sp. TY2-98 TaxID=2290922 RepID=UPI000E2089FE|nr:bifunctional (p)ppGpp synthetase/guanosine-3',5'-bis(diphosphate) 3'-pyrophosphohydrolase [Lysobacter sp. TY2-98]AXK71075.1 bifunctional (p)ppGpp synthetase/guanosine-3',5'-bis(diphosphate) 3'-pyrophosphohydrolase [Lysobacter sp. TY2-98]
MNAPSPPPTHPLADALAHPAATVLAAPLRTALESAAVAPVGTAAWALIESTLGSLATLGGDSDMVAATLVHDWPGLADALDAGFGARFPAVAALVESQHAAEPVSDLHARHPDGRGSEGLRRLLLAMVRDLRVVPILLARQLARLRLANTLPEDEQRALAALTRDIHAPLANRLGIWQLKWELEDLAFRFLEPATYQQIARLLDEKRVARERYIEDVKQTLRNALDAQGIRADVAGRPKHIYSIWKKMQRKNVPISELYDLRAVRILVDDLAACYAALGIVHATWAPIPSEFDDYIARPKRNDYRSLHTAVVGPEGKTLEVQIRTHDMHRQAELGVAAHWKYKEGGGPGGSSANAAAAFERKIAWMRRLLDAAGEEGALAGELDSELVEDRVYVLTPKGEVVDLPAGATPLDFAYHVHTEVGHRCRGAKIDGRIVPLDHKLRSGDHVEILTGKVSEPRRDWLVASNGFLASARSREKVRTWFNRLDRERNEQAGRDMLEKELRRLSMLNADLAPARERFHAESDDDLYVLVALGDVGPHQVGRALLEHERAARDAAMPVAPSTIVAPERHKPRSRDGEFTVEGVGNLLVQLARCCQPLPGEGIVGYLTKARGVSVHRPDCAAFERLAAAQPQRVLPVEWRRAGSSYDVDVELVAIDRKWLLKEVTNVVAQNGVGVSSLNTEHDRGGARVTLRLRLRVADYGQLSTVLGKLSALPGVEQARRA